MKGILVLGYCRAGLACCLVLLGAALAPVCRAVEASIPAIDLHHTSWSTRDGAPESIISITQTADGYLWLGGAAGLFRFDGIQFEPFVPANAALPTKYVSIVNAAPDGGLWVGYRTGGASYLRQGLIRNYGTQDGLPNRTVWGLEHDGNGRVWAATAVGLYYLERGRWHKPPGAWQLPDGPYKTLMRDRAGVLWAQGDAGVWSLKPGAARFARAAVDRGTGVLFELPDGNVVSWNAIHARLSLLTGARPGVRYPKWGSLGDPGSLLVDRRGDMWVGLLEGLELRTAKGISRAMPPQALSGRAVGAIFEDREGNVWTTTSAGVDRFRARRASRLDLPAQAIGGALLADDRGGVWVGAYHVFADGAGRVRVTPRRELAGGGPGSLLTSLARTGDGAMWGASLETLRRLQGSNSRPVALPAVLEGAIINGVLEDRDGSLLVALNRQGLYRRTLPGHWEMAGAQVEVNVMSRSDATGLWIGFHPGLVAQAQGRAWRTYGPADGLTLGMVMALHPHGRHLWAGGERGVALFAAHRFARLIGMDGETFHGVSGIVELENGDLWVNAFAALFHIPAAEVRKFEAQGDYRVRYERLDQLDGVEGSAPYQRPTPSLVLASDGRLWSARSTGIFRVDPAEPPPATPDRTITIKALGPSGAPRLPRPHLQFEPGSSALQIDYTRLALAMPERLRFRYRLDGVDDAWQDAGARRSAYYSNLAPGDYHFSVAATDYDGKWSDTPATVRFSIAPKATQTWWFRALCGLAVLWLAIAAYRLRIARLGRQMAARVQERVDERERIARELHDTLLQSVQGLVFHVHAAVLKLPAGTTARLHIESALQRAGEVLDEGRSRICELRGEDVGKLGFGDAVLAAAARLQQGGGCPVRLAISGGVRQLGPLIHRETLAIVTEALANACLHARASAIAVELHYGRREFRCILSDDGIGIPATVLHHGGRENHWGIRGMYERAAKIDARLAVRSDEDSGTTWQLDVPAALAYTR